MSTIRPGGPASPRPSPSGPSGPSGPGAPRPGLLRRISSALSTAFSWLGMSRLERQESAHQGLVQAMRAGWHGAAPGQTSAPGTGHGGRAQGPGTAGTEGTAPAWSWDERERELEDEARTEGMTPVEKRAAAQEKEPAVERTAARPGIREAAENQPARRIGEQRRAGGRGAHTRRYPARPAPFSPPCAKGRGGGARRRPSRRLQEIPRARSPAAGARREQAHAQPGGRELRELHARPARARPRHRGLPPRRRPRRHAPQALAGFRGRLRRRSDPRPVRRGHPLLHRPPRRGRAPRRGLGLGPRRARPRPPSGGRRPSSSPLPTTSRATSGSPPPSTPTRRARVPVPAARRRSRPAARPSSLPSWKKGRSRAASLPAAATPPPFAAGSARAAWRRLPGSSTGWPGCRASVAGPGAANELFAMTARMTGAGLGEAQDSVRLLARNGPQLRRRHDGDGGRVARGSGAACKGWASRLPRRRWAAGRY